MRQPVERELSIEGERFCLFEWPVADGPVAERVLLLHATGFHARCWDKVVAQLPADWQVFAYDGRGHGRSTKNGPYSWDQFAADLEAVATLLGLQGAIGVGHSMGGFCMAHVGARRADLFKRLFLIDPVIFSPDAYAELEAMFTDVADHPVARRKAQFDSWEAMFERFESRHPYSLWVPEILRDYCRYGVVPDPENGGVVLACPPESEAQVYMNNFTTNIHPLLADLNVPVTILRAPGRDLASPEMDFAASPTWPGLADYLPNARDVLLEDLTHFIPMQDPGLVADFVAGQR